MPLFVSTRRERERESGQEDNHKALLTTPTNSWNQWFRAPTIWRRKVDLFLIPTLNKKEQEKLIWVLKCSLNFLNEIWFLNLPPVNEAFTCSRSTVTVNGDWLCVILYLHALITNQTKALYSLLTRKNRWWDVQQDAPMWSNTNYDQDL